MYITPLPYKTWGLILDLKTKTKKNLLTIIEQRKLKENTYQTNNREEKVYM